MKEDNRERLRKMNEAELYRYKATLDTILEFLHIDVDLHSASVEENMKSVNTETLLGFQQHVCKRIDELDKLSTGRKNKGNIF